MLSYYTLLLLPADERWPEPGKSFVKLKLDDLLSKLSGSKSEKVEIVKHTFQGLNDNENCSVALRVVDQRVDGKTAYSIINVPTYGKIELKSDDCVLVKPTLGASAPVVRNQNDQIPKNEKLASELSVNNKVMSFPIIKDVDVSDTTLFDVKIVTEYTTVVYNDDYAKDDDSSDRDDEVGQLEAMTIYDIDDYDVIHFKRNELLKYNTAITAMFVACIENYTEIDDKVLKNAVDDFQNSYAALDLSNIFRSLRTFKNFLNSDLA